jgi:hypothetical protein
VRRPYFTWEFKFDRAVFKGNLERLFLFLSLVYDIPHALIAFGALKIGTRIRPNEKITNDLLSVGDFAIWGLLAKP